MGVVGRKTVNRSPGDRRDSRKEGSLLGRGLISEQCWIGYLCVSVYVLIIKRQLMSPELKNVAFLEVEFCLGCLTIEPAGRLP